MKLIETLLSRLGATWTVEHRESARLSNIGGFLMTYQDRGRITLNTRLSSDQKERGRSTLLERLADTPTGTSGVYLWDPNE